MRRLYLPEILAANADKAHTTLKLKDSLQDQSTWEALVMGSWSAQSARP